MGRRRCGAGLTSRHSAAPLGRKLIIQSRFHGFRSGLPALAAPVATLPGPFGTFNPQRAE